MVQCYIKLRGLMAFLESNDLHEMLLTPAENRRKDALFETLNH